MKPLFAYFSSFIFGRPVVVRRGQQVASSKGNLGQKGRDIVKVRWICNRGHWGWRG